MAVYWVTHYMCSAVKRLFPFSLIHEVTPLLPSHINTYTVALKYHFVSFHVSFIFCVLLNISTDFLSGIALKKLVIFSIN